MSRIDYYYNDISGPCRAVWLCIHACKLDVNKIVINIRGGDQNKPEFKAINPQHCVPTIVDGDLKLWESRAIISYLAAKYGDESLYPKDLKIRAEVDRLLQFDLGTLYYRFGEYAFPVMFRGADKPDPAKLEKVHEALGWLDDLLETHSYLVGDNITIADHSIVATVSTMNAVGIEVNKHPRLASWLERCATSMPLYAESCDEGLKMFGEWVKTKLQK